MPERQTGRRPRLLHLHSSFNLGGKEARAIRLMNLWGDKAEHAIVSGVPAMLGARDSIDPGIAVDFPDAPPLQGKPSLARFRALQDFMRGYDLILTYNWGAMDGVMAHRLGTNMPPLIHHEDGFNEDEADGTKWSRNLYRRLALARAEALVVPSETLQRIALNQWGQGHRLHLIPNGIPTALYRQPPEDGALPGLARNPGDVIVGTAAGLRPVKDLTRLVRAVAPLPDPVKLVIVGEGPDRDAIQAAARDTGMADRLIMPGFLKEPWRWIGHFDIFALSSRSEQAPISLVEAMAAGLPAVCTDVGDVKAMVARANRQFIANEDLPYREALICLAGDEALRRLTGAANKERAAAVFEEAHMVEAYARLYGLALARPEVLL